jgi:predicted DNA-binding transcriptional regulator AlpA
MEAYMQLISEKKFRVETLGISATSSWRLKKAGDLPVSIIIGRRNYYLSDSIMEWLAKKQGGMDQQAKG